MKRILPLLFVLASCGATSKTVEAPSTFKPTTFSVKVTGTGRPVIFIPGLASPGAVWDGTLAHLGDKIQAHVITIAGMAGEPPVATSPLLRTVRDEIIQYGRANHLKHPIVVGHSLGGFMVYWLTATEADLFAGGVAVDGMPFFSGFEDPTMTAAQAEPKAKEFRDTMLQGGAAMFEAGVKMFVSHMVTDPATIEMLSTVSAKSDPATVSNAMYELSTTDLRPLLPKIKAPILVVAADTAGQVPREGSGEGLEHRAGPDRAPQSRSWTTRSTSSCTTTPTARCRRDIDAFFAKL